MRAFLTELLINNAKNDTKMEKFNVNERVWCKLNGKRRLSKIRSFVPQFGGGGVLATIIVENREYAVSLDSLEKTGKNRKSSTSKETTT